MRGTVDNLRSPHPLGVRLPAIYQDEDAFSMRMTQAFDELLAPVIATLDSLPAYFDPALAPEDFVDWLAEWVGMEIDETWDLALRRQVVADATDLHGRRGTAAGIAAQVRLVTGGDVEVLESGGTAWSVDAGSPFPGSAHPALQVRVRVADPAAVDPARLDRLVTAVKPAHVPHTIEILPLKGGGGGRGGAGGSGGSGGPGGNAPGESAAAAGKPEKDGARPASGPPASAPPARTTAGGQPPASRRRQRRSSG